MSELNEINDSLAELEEELSKLKSASSMIAEAKNTAQTTIEESKKIFEVIISNSKEATDFTIQESKKLNESAQKLLNAVDILMNKLDKVDFPTRLDKLDNSVTGINIAIQNIFGRIGTVEKNLKENFNLKISHLNQKLEQSQKLNMKFLILILLLTGSSLVILLLKF